MHGSGVRVGPGCHAPVAANVRALFGAPAGTGDAGEREASRDACLMSFR